MKNSELPAYPISEEETDRVDDGVTIYTGLTKREYFSVLAMQGLMSEEFSHDGHELTKAETIARRAIRCADELLKQLEK